MRIDDAWGLCAHNPTVSNMKANAKKSRFEDFIESPFQMREAGGFPLQPSAPAA
jgi:hypothetical protein